VAELKCTLRFLWHIAQGKAQPRVVTAAALAQDEVLLAALGSAEEVQRGLQMAVERQTLLVAKVGVSGIGYVLHTPENRRSVEALPSHSTNSKVVGGEPPQERLNIYRLYEENIGALTPLVADELRDAEDVYPEEWVLAAFQEAVAQNKRSWRYISRILERWSTEGFDRGGHGESGRYSQTTSAAEYLRRF